MEKFTSPEEMLSEIRQLMERSSRFISLSGLSGVLAGVYAMLGVFAASYYVFGEGSRPPLSIGDAVTFLVIVAGAVVVLAVGTGVFLTTRKARKDGNSIFDGAARKLIINLCIPLIAGGIFCLALIYHQHWLYIAPAMLIFYGLALVNASKYTRNDIRSLGIAELAIGLIALFATPYGLWLWALGFGVFHILYGTYMYVKYEK